MEENPFSEIMRRSQFKETKYNCDVYFRELRKESSAIISEVVIKDANSGLYSYIRSIKNKRSDLDITKSYNNIDVTTLITLINQ